MRDLRNNALERPVEGLIIGYPHGFFIQKNNIDVFIVLKQLVEDMHGGVSPQYGFFQWIIRFLMGISCLRVREWLLYGGWYV